ncbi:MAG: TCP-1/cpn60 chaperonin family protein [Candidatus Aenigmarchaeota archaeon]|nr:TCP-1/cpn60 chaperonin family protein [Candidatus Aenigmarchaeota archaeon]
MNGQNIQPIFILPEGALRTRGKDALKNNIAAAKAVADAVRTTLGPKGMDKMLVDSLGDVVITNDGATILEEMQIENPAAKMIMEVAKTQDKIVGDGTTTAAVMAGELLKKAEELLEQEIHPTVIIKGFMLAKQRSLEVLDKIATKVTINDETVLKQLAQTAMTGKSAEMAADQLAEVVVKAVKKVFETKGNAIETRTDNIKLEKREGGSVTDTQLIQGVAIDKEIVHSGMPKRIEKAKIALLDAALEIKELEGDAKINIDSPDKFQAFLDQQEKQLKDMVEKVVKSNANVVLCQKGIDDVAQHYLAKKGILAARRVKKSDMELLAKSTGAKIISNLNDLGHDDLGYADVVYEKKVADEEMIFVEGCKDPKAVTILIRGGTQHIVDELERGLNDAIKGVASALDLGKIIGGGGASEMEVARELRKYAETFKGREQLAIVAFAEALEVIPRALAENAGLDPIDMLVELRAEHDKGRASSGLDVFTGKSQDTLKTGVVEPLKIKIQAIKSASEAAEMILRIDDVISSGKSERGPKMPPGAGDMGGEGDY